MDMVMDLQANLDRIQFKEHVLEVVDWVGDDTERFHRLLEFILKGTNREQQKSAWVLTTICEAKPELAQPYLARFLDLLDHKGLHQGLYRCLIRIMMTCELPEKLHARIHDTMTGIMMDPGRSIAERAFAIHVGTRIIKLHPELKDEFSIVLDEIGLTNTSPAIASSIRNARKVIRKTVIG